MKDIARENAKKLIVINKDLEECTELMNVCDFFGVVSVRLRGHFDIEMSRESDWGDVTRETNFLDRQDRSMSAYHISSFMRLNGYAVKDLVDAYRDELKECDPKQLDLIIKSLSHIRKEAHKQIKTWLDKHHKAQKEQLEKYAKGGKE